MFYRRKIEPAKKLHMKVNDNIYKVKCFQNVMKSVEKVSIDIYCKWLITLRMNEFFFIELYIGMIFFYSVALFVIFFYLSEKHTGAHLWICNISAPLYWVLWVWRYREQASSPNTKTHLENLTIQEITYIHIFFMGMHLNNAHFLSDSL